TASCFTATAQQPLKRSPRSKPNQLVKAAAADFRFIGGVGGQDNHGIAVNPHGAPSRRERTSSSVMPSIRITLSRDLRPCSRMVARLEIFNWSARKQRRAALAFPSTACARNLILIAPPCAPATL